MDANRKETALVVLKSIIEDMNAASSLCESGHPDDREVKRCVEDSDANLDMIKGDLYELLNDKIYCCESLDCILMYLERTDMQESGSSDDENYRNVPHAAWCLRKLYDDITGENTAGEFVPAGFDHNSFYDRINGVHHFSINLREGIIRGYFKESL
ncbi:hypothetical protein AGMMS49543_20850 [Betaproteobacteria bacterium]|nr:hypothetical protein AGMMS49543_20850 [Betaproteobacteria bacterium]